MKNEILLRIRYVFKDSGKTQTDIGRSIGKTSQYVWKLLNDDNSNPSESVIKDICREFSINEEWLRTGQGEMKREKTRNQRVLEFTNDALESMDGSFKKKLLMALSKLTEKDWEHLADIAERILKEE